MQYLLAEIKPFVTTFEWQNLVQFGCKTDNANLNALFERRALRCGSIITDKDFKKVLLVKNRYCGKWGLPKGSALPGEDVFACARRETLEECGVDILAHSIRQTVKIDKQFFVLVTLQHKVKICVHDTREIEEAKFIPIYKIPLLYSNMNLKLFYKHLTAQQ